MIRLISSGWFTLYDFDMFTSAVRCFGFGPAISCVDALHTVFAISDPSIVWIAACSRSTTVCPDFPDIATNSFGGWYQIKNQ